MNRLKVANRPAEHAALRQNPHKAPKVNRSVSEAETRDFRRLALKLP
jgi:hypothetical protein